MRKWYVAVYDLQMREVARLENAFDISYEKPMNALWMANFSLPIGDPKNKECRPHYFVEIYDNDERIELFRILPQTGRRSDQIQSVTYECEHVLATLLDDVLFQYHTVGNLGYYTRNVFEYILSKQIVRRWAVGNVQFARQFEYNWENENLLGALFSVPKPFTESYMFTFDTRTMPWKINLVALSGGAQAYIRYGKNLKGIEKTEDPSELCTRIYGLGYGEGVNQLTFADINGKKPYLDAEPAYQARYGIISSIFVDRRFEYPETLKARCQVLLDELKQPRLTYKVDAAELYALTKDPIDKFVTGTLVRVLDEEMGVDIEARVVNVKKPDPIGSPGNVELEIANRPQDIAGSIADLRNRMHVNDVYAQGATNYDSHDFADNCDKTHPAVLRFWLPEETARVNKVSLTFRTEAFRGYSRAIEAAPTATSGPSSRQTSGASSSRTTANSAQLTANQSTVTTTSNGGGTISTETGKEIWIIDWVYGAGEVVERIDDHNHGLAAGTKLRTADGGVVTWSPSGGHRHGLSNHYHVFALQPHSHDFRHTHTIDPHTHNMEHTHDMDHTHEIPGHTHEIEFGIYEGPVPASVKVMVDGVVIPGLTNEVDEFDILPYLSKDGSGRVQRGTYHEIQITPDSLGRVVASVFTQIFAQSRGGGDF